MNPCAAFWANLTTALTSPGSLAKSTADAAAQAANQASIREVEEMSCPCEDKWLVITITRHTKHEFGKRWDCTVGDLIMEVWDKEDSGSGPLVFKCKTSERGGPAHADFHYKNNNTGRYIIVARDSYGVAPWSGGKYKTYSYSTGARSSGAVTPRPGISVYGSSAGAMDKRSAVLIHMGSSHRWSVGCIVLHKSGSVSGDRYRFDLAESYDTVVEFLQKIHEFKGTAKLTIRAKIGRVKLIIKENF